MPRTCHACRHGSTEVHPSHGATLTRAYKVTEDMVIPFQFWIEVPRAPSVASIRTHIVALTVLSPPIAKFCNSRAQAKWLPQKATSRAASYRCRPFLVPQRCSLRCKCMPNKTEVLFTLSSHIQLTRKGVLFMPLALMKYVGNR